MSSFNEITGKLKKIKEMGYIKTHRKGDTGIGKTLEDLLEITENNIPGPNAEMIELKSARKNTSSMLTLFTKSPLPRGANSVLLQTFGYESSRAKGRKELHTTVYTLRFNQLRGRQGFKIDIKQNGLNLVTTQNEILGYWDKETLKNSFERKLPNLLYVKAETRGRGTDEEFWFNEAWLLSGFNFENFINLLKEGTIKVDIRIGQFPDGRPHDHGTGFRVLPDKLDLCFENRKRVV